MKLLIDQTSDDKLIVESSTDTSTGAMYLEGPFLMSEAVNRNKRLYPKQLMERCVDQYIKEFINERRALGELNHPEYPFPDPAKAALITESLTWNKNNVVGKARIINSPQGQQIKALMEAGFRMGVSSRGLGKLKQLREHALVERYTLNAIDGVDKPSGQTCYVDAVNEAMLTEWTEENGVWVQKQRFDEAAFGNALDKMLEVLKANRKDKLSIA